MEEDGVLVVGDPYYLSYLADWFSVTGLVLSYRTSSTFPLLTVFWSVARARGADDTNTGGYVCEFELHGIEVYGINESFHEAIPQARYMVELDAGYVQRASVMHF